MKRRRFGALSTPSRLQTEKLTTKADDIGIGHCCLARIKPVSERQKFKDSLVRVSGRSAVMLVRYCALTLLAGT